MGVSFHVHSSSKSLSGFIEKATRAEELGFRGVWVADNQFDVVDPFQLVAACASHTKRLIFGTAATNIVFRDATLLSGQAASANQITDGRFILGLGTGDSATYILGRSPTKMADLERRVTELRTLLRGGTTDTTMGPIKHYYSRGGDAVPVYLAVEGPRGLKVAGRVADGVILGSGFDLNLVQWSREQIAAGAAEAGRDPSEIDLMVAGIIYVDEDGDYARERAKPRLANRAHHNFRHSLDSVPESEQAGVRAFMDAVDLSKPLEERLPPDMIPDYLVNRFAIAGTPDECADRVEALTDIGIDNFLLTPPEAAWNDALTTWSQHVMVKFDSRAES